MKQMKTLTIGPNTYEVVDETARGRTYTDIGAAPAGYGLGKTANTYYPTSEAELNTMLDEVLSGLEDESVGFYAFKDNTGSLWGSGECIALVRKTGSDYATVEFCSYNHQGAWLLKTKYGGVWTPLEWVNPPIYPSVEYRTTERWNGNPVYVMRVNAGALPNATTKIVSVVSDGDIIRCNACAFSGNESISIPFTVGSGYTIGCHGQRGSVILYSTYDCSGFSDTYVTAWYTKD